MEKIIYRLTLDTHKNGIQKTLQGFETADNMARRIAVSLVSGSDTFEIDAEHVTAMAYVTTPEATEPSINACTIEDNTIIYDVLPIATEGITEMQFKLIATRPDGAKAVLASPKIAVEVTQSNADDSGAEQTTTFTALEDAVARANGVYNARLLRVEITEDCVFKAYYADGTEYENDGFKEYIDKLLNETLKQVSMSEINAKVSESNARASETNAKASEINAEESEINAKESEKLAKEYMGKAFSGTPEGYEQLVEDVSLLDIKKSTAYTLPNSKEGGYHLLELEGNSAQSGTPTFDMPIEIVSMGSYDEERGKYVNVIKTYDDNGNETSVTLYTQMPILLGDVLYEEDGIYKIKHSTVMETLDASRLGFQNSYACAAILLHAPNPNAQILSSHLVYNATADFDSLGGFVLMHFKEGDTDEWGAWFVCENEAWQDETTFAEWVSENAITILYTLEEPIYETIDTATQQALNELKAFEGTTYIAVNNGVGIMPKRIVGEYGTSKVGAVALESRDAVAKARTELEDKTTGLDARITDEKNYSANTYQTKNIDITKKGFEWGNGEIDYSGILQRVAYGNGKFVAVGSNGVRYSKDGIHWFASYAGNTIFNDVSFGTYNGNSYFMIAGSAGSIFYSNDGIKWDKYAQLNDVLLGITIAESTIVVVGNGGAIYYFTDNSWTKVSGISTDILFKSVTCNSENTFVAVGFNNIVYYSTDGKAWNVSNFYSANTVNFNDVTFGNGKFIAVATGGYIYYSTDGITWTYANKIGTSLIAVCYNSEKTSFITVGNDSDYNGIAYCSTNGITWTATGLVDGVVLNGVVYGNGLYVTCGGGYIGYSNGENYIEEDNLADVVDELHNDLHYGNILSAEWATITGTTSSSVLEIPWELRKQKIYVLSARAITDSANCICVPFKTCASAGSKECIKILDTSLEGITDKEVTVDILYCRL